MPDYDLKLGERLEVLRGDRHGVSNIQAFTKSGQVIISEPMHREAYLSVQEGDLLNLFYYRPFGMLSCVVTAERVYRDAELGLIETEIRSQISRHQRREFVRFETLLPVTVVPLVASAETNGINEDMAVRLLTDRLLTEAHENALEGITLDISGGGLRFTCPKKLIPGTLAACIVSLNDTESVCANIRAVRSEAGLDGQFIIGAKFVGISDSRRGKIIRYIIDKHRGKS